MTVTPLGVDDAFVPGDPDLPGELPAGVTPPYLLHVGDLHERRNLLMLVDAVLAARRQCGALAPHRAGVRGGDPPGTALSLVLAGADLGVGDAVCAIAARAGAADAVVRLGPVSEKRLRTLYRGAIALAYPSLYEGFGLPLVEAMACGTPVIASNTASMPEVLGDAGILLDPSDGQAWTRAIIDVVTHDQPRGRLRTAGLRRAADFTWERTARLTLDVYRRTVAQ
jgi:glycosyltransferase involved in cell wall biosynthesis